MRAIMQEQNERSAYCAAVSAEKERLEKEIKDQIFSSSAKEKCEKLEKILAEIRRSDTLEFLKSQFDLFVNSRRGKTGFFEPAFTTSRKNITVNYLRKLIDMNFSNDKANAKKIVEKLEKELKRNDSATVWNGRAEARSIMNRLETAIKGVEEGGIKSTDDLRELLVSRNYSRVSPIISPK